MLCNRCTICKRYKKVHNLHKAHKMCHRCTTDYARFCRLCQILQVMPDSAGCEPCAGCTLCISWPWLQRTAAKCFAAGLPACQEEIQNPRFRLSPFINWHSARNNALDHSGTTLACPACGLTHRSASRHCRDCPRNSRRAVHLHSTRVEH